MSRSGSRFLPSFHLTLLTSAAVLLWAYWPTWGVLAESWRSDADYNHGFLVIPIALWLLWQRIDRLDAISINPSWWGLIFLLGAAAVRWLGAEYFFIQFDSWSIPLWITGMVLMLAGWQALRWSAGAIAFLWFMAPVPATLIDFLTEPLQQASAVLSTWTLHLLAQPAVRQITTISLGEHTLDVERACSGLRICYGTLALATAYAILVRGRLYRSALLIAASIPVAILANSFRVTLTGLMLQFFSDETANQYAHDFLGFLMLPIAVLMLWLTHVSIDKVAAAFGDSSQQGSLLLLKWGGAAGIVTVVLSVWQSRQADAAVETLLQIAERHESSAQKFEDGGERADAILTWRKAAESLDQYCALRPQDVPATRRLAAAAERLATSAAGRARAMRLYKRAWEFDPGDHELGFKVAYLAMGADLDSDAIQAADLLLATLPPGSAEQLEAYGLKTAAMSRDAERPGTVHTSWAQLLTTLEWGIEQSLDPVSCAFQMAVIYHTQPVEGVPAGEGPTRAAEVLETLISNRPHDPLAWFARYAYRIQYSLGRPADVRHPRNVSTEPGELRDAENSRADGTAVASVSDNGDSINQQILTESASASASDPNTDLDQAIALAEELQDKRMLPIWLAAGDRAIRRHDNSAAEKFYQQATVTDPEHYRGYLQLARLITGLDGATAMSREVTAEQRKAAISILRQARERESLRGEVLLQVELLRQQLQSDDPAEITNANVDLKSMKQQLRELPPEIGILLQLNVAMTEAEIYSAAGDPVRATAVLKSVLNQKDVDRIPAGGGILSGAWLVLGGCYEQQDLAELAQECYDKAAAVEPTSVSNVWFQAMRAEDSYDHEVAAALYRGLAERLGNRPEPWIAAARTELVRQRRLLPRNRDLSRVVQALARAKAAGAGAGELAVPEAEFRVLGGDEAAAVRILEKATEEDPHAAEIWRTLATLYQTTGNQTLSNSALERFRQTVQSPVDSAVLEADLLAGREQRNAARQLLDRAIAESSEIEDRRRLVEKRVQIDLSASDLNHAQQILEEFAKQNPDDAVAQMQLAEFYWGRRSLEQLKQVEADLQKAEGESGVLWQELRARRLIETASHSRDPEQQVVLLQEANILLQRIQNSTVIPPAAIHTLVGRMRLVEGRYAEAATAFEAAWELRRDSVVSGAELIFALKSAGQTERAGKYLLILQSLIPQSPELFDLALEMQSSILTDDPQLAETVSRGWTQAIGDADSYLRLARVLAREGRRAFESPSGRLTEAEAAFRKAIELNPSNPQVWGELIRFLYEQKKATAAAIRETDRFLAADSVPEIDRVFAAARLLMEFNLPGQAARYWHKSVSLADQHPNPEIRIRVLSTAIEFFLQTDISTAEVVARRLFALQPESPDNLRLLLSVLIARKSPESIRSAQPIAEALKAAASPPTDQDRRVLASYLYERARLLPAEFHAAEDEQAALLLLSSITAVTAEDTVQLARINAALGNSSTALLALRDVVTRTDAPLEGLRTFVELYETQSAASGLSREPVERVLDRIEQIQGVETMALELRLRSAAGDPDETFRITSEFLIRVSALQSTPDAAETLLQSVFLGLAQSGRHDIAFRLYYETNASFTKAQKLTALLLAVIAQPSARDFELQLKNLLASELPLLDDATTDRAAADYYFLRADLENAERVYRRCLARNSRDVGAANNLALVVAENRQDFAEAGRLLERAQAVPPTDEMSTIFLSDTRAWLLLQRGQPEEAFAILKPLCESVGADGTVLLHMAECARQQSRSEEARAAFLAARQVGLASHLLTPMDRRIVSQFSTE